MGLFGEILRENHLLLESEKKTYHRKESIEAFKDAYIKKVIQAQGITPPMEKIGDTEYTIMNTEIEYPTYYKELPIRDDKISDEDKLYGGYVLLPLMIYSVDLELSQEILIRKSLQGFISITDDLNVSREYIEDEKWQYQFEAWGQTTLNDKYYLSNKGRYFSSNIGVQINTAPQEDQTTEGGRLPYAYAPELTKILQGLILEKRITPSIMSNEKQEWHKKLAYSFLSKEQLTHIPYYFNGTNVNNTTTVKVIDGIIIPQGTAAINIQVDHMNGTHYDNRLENLRIVDASTNAAAARVYKLFKWTLSLTPDCTEEIYTELVYDYKKERTVFKFTINGEELSPEETQQYIQFSVEVILSQEMGNSRREDINTTYGMLRPNQSLTIIQTPVILGLSNGERIIADSLQAACYLCSDEKVEVAPINILNAIKNGGKPPQKDEKVSILWASFATNQTIDKLPIPKTLNEIESYDNAVEGLEGFFMKKGNELRMNYGAGLVARKKPREIIDTINQIYDTNERVKDEEAKIKKKKNVQRTNVPQEVKDITKNEFFCEMQEGRFTLMRYDPLREDYLNINSDKYQNEKWFRGYYFGGKEQASAVKHSGKNIFIAPLIGDSDKFFFGKEVYDQANNTVSKNCYGLMCSDCGRIASWEKNSGYKIVTSSYFTAYPHNDKPMYAKTIKISPEGYTFEDISGDTSCKGRDIQYHILMFDSVNFLSSVDFYRRYPDYETRVIHHKNADSSIYALSNLEIVSNHENTLFSGRFNGNQGFTCIGLFQVIGQRLVPLLVWPNINSSNRKYKTFNDYYSQSVNSGEFDRIVSKLPPQETNVIEKALRLSGEYLPEVDMANGNGEYVYRYCLTKDFKFEVSSAEDAAKEVVAIIYYDKGNGGQKHYSWWSTDSKEYYLTFEELVQYRKEHPEFQEMTPYFDYTGNNGQASPTQTQPSQNNVPPQLQESIDKMRSLISRMK